MDNQQQPPMDPSSTLIDFIEKKEEINHLKSSQSLFDEFLQQHVVLIFLPNTNELQRFILSDAFKELNLHYKLHYILPSADAEKMQALAPHVLTKTNSSVLAIPAERFDKWSQLFQAACFHYAQLSPSFAIRANFSLRSNNAFFFKIIPQAWWPYAARVIQGLLKFSWPGRFKSFLQKLLAALNKANTYPEKFSLIQADKYKEFKTHILAEMKPLPDIIALFDQFNPIFCIVPTSLLDLFCNDVVWACESESIACVLLQSGWDNLSSKGVIHSTSPFLACWGPQSMQHAHAIQGLPYNKIHTLGSPHYELLKPAPLEEITRLRNELGVSQGEKIILFGGSFRQFDETSLLKTLDKAISDGYFGAVKILYRPHPWRATRQHEDNFFDQSWNHILFDPDMKSRYLREQKEKGYIKRNVPVFDMHYLAQILTMVDAVISPMSTLLIESLIMNKPTMAIAFGDGKHAHDPSMTSQMTHFAELKNSKALIWCSNSKLFLKNCLELLTKNNSPQWQEACQQLLNIIVQREPGTYSERLANFCKETVERKARKLRGHRVARRRVTISHAYGAHRIARNYCGLNIKEPRIPGYWMHGWIPAYHNMSPALIALHKKEGQSEGYDYKAQIEEEKENVWQWVSRQDQADYLIKNGYKKVKAIGLPITYLPKPTTQRIPGSLLVLPPHSHRSHGPDDPLANEYAKTIADLKSKFSIIWVGLNEDDIAKRQWIESFHKEGIKVFNTTDQADPNTLMRLMQILSTFEYVTTNGYGSHIALAAYCGAKVSIYGPYAEFPLERMKTTHAVKMFPSLLETAFYLCTEAALQKHYPFLFLPPDQANQLTQWGAHEVGETHRLPPNELAALFQWSILENSSCLESAL